MAKDLYDAHENVRQFYHEANDILGFDLAKVCFEGPEDELKKTLVTQPAIFVHSAALDGFVKQRGLSARMAAGHSLGEYSALYSAGALTFEDALKIVKVRAELMQKAGEVNPGTMAAVMGLDAATLNEVCQKASSAGVVQVANFNSPAQIVISGSVAGVEQAMELAKEAGAKRVVPLVVGGAFHSPLMEYATDGLSETLSAIPISTANIPVYTNVTARPVSNSSEIKELLLQQLTSPVRWVEIVQNMIKDGANQFYEIGPGSVLTGLLKRIDREVTAKSIANLTALEEIVA